MNFHTFILLMFFLLNCVFVSNSQNDTIIIKEIHIIGNTKTNSSVIYRELPFKKNENVDKNDIEKIIIQAKNNLLNTSLFNFVDIFYLINGNEISISIKLEERWYYLGYPILEYADRSLSSFLYYRDFLKINYGFAFDWHNFRGQNELLRFKIRLGYKEQYSISYHKKGFGQRKVYGMWYISEFFRQKKSINAILENKPIYAENREKYIKENINLGLGITYRPKINYKLNLGVIYQHSTYKDSTYFILNFPSSNTVNTKYISPKIRFEFDARNSIVYPTDGFFFSLGVASYYGVNNFSEKFYTISSKLDYNKALFRNFIFYRIESSYNKFFNSNANILFDKKLDFCSTYMIRGYEYYYFLSSQFINFQNTISFKVSDFKIHQLPECLPKEFSKTFTKLYLDLFFDFAYTNKSKSFYEVTNPMNDMLLWSCGVGVSLETYYDRLIQIHAVYNAYFDKIGIFVEWKAPLYKLY